MMSDDSSPEVGEHTKTLVVSPAQLIKVSDNFD